MQWQTAMSPRQPIVCESCVAGTRRRCPASCQAAIQRVREGASEKFRRSRPRAYTTHARTHARARARTRAHTRTHTAGVSEACTRQAKGRRGASNGFAALQDLAEYDAGSDAADASGAGAVELEQLQAAIRGIRAQQPALGAKEMRAVLVQSMGWQVSVKRVKRAMLENGRTHRSHGPAGS